jgi:hypothetical protein
MFIDAIGVIDLSHQLRVMAVMSPRLIGDAVDDLGAIFQILHVSLQLLQFPVRKHFCPPCIRPMCREEPRHGAKRGCYEHLWLATTQALS